MRVDTIDNLADACLSSTHGENKIAVQQFNAAVAGQQQPHQIYY